MIMVALVVEQVVMVVVLAQVDQEMLLQQILLKVVMVDLTAHNQIIMQVLEVVVIHKQVVQEKEQEVLEK